MYLDQGIDAESIVIEDPVSLIDDANTLNIIFNQNKMFEQLSFFSMQNELLEYKGNTILFRNKEFKFSSSNKK